LAGTSSFPPLVGFLIFKLSWHILQGWAHTPRQQSSAATLKRTANGKGETRGDVPCLLLASRKGETTFRLSTCSSCCLWSWL